jgi:hypothetical protein
MRQMIALKTSASSGLISSRSASVFDDANCSSGPGAGQAVLNEAVIGELKQFLDADSAVPQHLDDRPSPKPMLLGPIQQYQLASVGVGTSCSSWGSTAPG